MKNVIFTLGVVLMPILLQAQMPNIAPKALHLTIDNDAFLFSQTDQYYSSGIYAQYLKATPAEDFFLNYLGADSSTQVVKHLSLNHQVYTPIKFNSFFLADYDRPHAALLYGGFGFQLVRPGIIIDHELALGWMGPALQTGPLLNFWHDVFNYREPRGWDYEISNSPVVQLNVGINKALIQYDRLNLNWENTVQLGTIYADAQSGVSLRVGRLKPLHRSMLYNLSFLQPSSPPAQVQEWYGILKSSIQWVGYNATIEGNLIGNDSPHTESIEHWVHHWTIGGGMAWNRFDVQISLNYRSVEVISASRHKFVQFKMNYSL